jgi:hypothetical protein
MMVNNFTNTNKTNNYVPIFLLNKTRYCWYIFFHKFSIILSYDKLLTDALTRIIWDCLPDYHNKWNIKVFNKIKYSIHVQHYVIKFVSDLRQVGGFLLVLRFPSPIKLIRHDIIEILLNVVLNNPHPQFWIHI